MAILNLEQLMEQASRAASAANEAQLQALRRYLEEAANRLRTEIRRNWPGATDESRIFREARAYALLQQLDPAIQALQLSTPGNPVMEATREAIRVGREQAAQQTRTFFERLVASGVTTYTAQQIMEFTAFSSQVNLAAVQAQVMGAAARLKRYSDQAIDKINVAVVNGMVAGTGWRSVAMEVRTALLGDPNAKPLYQEGYDALGRRRQLLVPGSGGLAFQAETIARTEMISSLQDARDGYYDQMNVELVVWFATEDERTCRFCGARSGNIYKREDVILPAHPRCRCVASPFRWEWVEDGVIDLGELEAHRAKVLEEYRKEHGEDARFATGASPFEKAEGRTEAPQPVSMPSNITPRDPLWAEAPTAAAAGPTGNAAAGEGAASLGGRPGTGPAVGASLDLPGARSFTGRNGAEAMAVIDSVHTDGNLPTIPLASTRSEQVHGAYRYYTGGPRAGTSLDIQLSTRTSQPLTTIAHEVGHFIDHQGWGTPGVLSSKTREAFLGEWRTAVESTQAVQQIQSVRQAGGVLQLDNGRTAHFRRSGLDYLLSQEELWARSYAQYIAETSGHAGMLDEIETERRTGLLPTQWSAEDFVPVRVAIDELFRRLGWRM